MNEQEVEMLTGHKETMTSLEIAELTGKQHAHVMRDIRALIDKINESTSGLVDCREDYHRGDRTQYKYLSNKTQAAILDWCFGKQNTSSYIIESSTYKDTKGEERNMYILNKKACLLLASGYDVILRAKIINRWEELETKERTGGFVVPQTFSQALMLAARQQEEIEKQKAALVQQGNEIIKLSNEITSMRPKAEYYDKIMSCTDSIDITQVALDYGMSARALNKKLHELRIQYKVNKQWILYSDYLQCGYVRSIPVDISKDRDWSKTTNHTRWTRRGVIFIYEKLKTIGILPLMERQ